MGGGGGQQTSRCIKKLRQGQCRSLTETNIKLFNNYIAASHAKVSRSAVSTER